MTTDSPLNRQLIKLRDVIIYFFEKDPATRNCDKRLTVRVIQFYLGRDRDRDPERPSVTISADDFNKIPSFESIKRARAFIQNVERIYLPTDARVRERRKIAEEPWLEYSVKYPKQAFPEIKKESKTPLISGC